MDCLVPTKLLEFKPDTLQYVRKLYNLDKPGRMKEAVNILKEWVQKQSHFNKKDISPRILELAIIVSKGSIERAKKQVDKICTMRTLYPEFYEIRNTKTDFPGLFDICYSVVLPKLTNDHYRVYVAKLCDKTIDVISFFYRFNFIMAEYMMAHDYFCGVIFIVDLTGINLMSFIMKWNPIELKTALTVFIEGYGVRVKAIHFISDTKFVDSALSWFKPMVSAKIGSRISVLKSYEELHKFFPEAILPEDYGGKERSLKTLQEEWVEKLSSEEHLRRLEVMKAVTTNESCRQKNQFSEQYAGMPGTFRFLSVD